MISRADLVLLSGGWCAHELALYRHRHSSITLGLLVSTLTEESAAIGPRTYQIRTYGCQMNVHDSERLAGLLEEAGYHRAAEDTLPDVVVFNTCAVRENADNRLYWEPRQSAAGKEGKAWHADRRRWLPGAEGPAIRSSPGAPWVDVVFGTHNIGSLPVLLERARIEHEAQVEIIGGPGDLPVQPADPQRFGVRGLGLHQRRLQQHLHLLHRARRCAARETDRRPGDILAEIRGAWWPRACRR